MNIYSNMWLKCHSDPISDPKGGVHQMEMWVQCVVRYRGLHLLCHMTSHMIYSKHSNTKICKRRSGWTDIYTFILANVYRHQREMLISHSCQLLKNWLCWKNLWCAERIIYRKEKKVCNNAMKFLHKGNRFHWGQSDTLSLDMMDKSTDMFIAHCDCNNKGGGVALIVNTNLNPK